MKRCIRDLVDLKGKRVLLRTDFNVPLDDVGRILDKTRIVAEIPTIKYLVERGADISLIDEINNLPIDYAIDEKDEDVIKYLLTKQRVDEKRLEKISTIMNCEEYKWI